MRKLSFLSSMGALIGVSLLAWSGFAFSADPYLEGRDYTLLGDRVMPVDPNKIEVVEAFSFHCPHCYHFEDQLSAWAKKLPADVNFIQMHVSWMPQMEPLQRGFYTAVALNIKNKIQMPAFTAYQVQRNELKDAQAWADLLSGFGVSKQTVLATYDSFGVSSLIRQADARAKGYKINGTPTLVIDGRFRISTPEIPGADEAKLHETMLKIADFLIQKVRAERTGKH